MMGILLMAVLFAYSRGYAEREIAFTGIPTSPELVKPLKVGDEPPEAFVRDSNGKAIELRALVLSKPTVLIFYRGGWCPYCNTHLGELAVVEPALLKAGYQIVAISPDSPEKIRMNHKPEIHYTILSDSKMNAARAFGLAFQVDEDTVHRYKKDYKIDLEADSGETHHMLPVPAAYIVDGTGLISFVYYNANYKTRIDPQLLLEKAQTLAPKAR